MAVAAERQMEQQADRYMGVGAEVEIRDHPAELLYLAELAELAFMGALEMLHRREFLLAAVVQLPELEQGLLLLALVEN